MSIRPTSRCGWFTLLMLATTCVPMRTLNAASDAGDSKTGDAYTVGKSWLGEADENRGNKKNILLKRRENDRVTFVFEGGASGAKWRVSGALSKGKVIFDQLERVVNPQGVGSVIVKDVAGGAMINPDGTLDFRVTATVSGGGFPANKPFSVTFRQATPN